jgi:hypothetical protein
VSNSKETTYLNMPIPELVRALRDHGQVGSQLHSEITGALQAALAMHLAASIDKHERAATRLSNQLLVLNIILGIFTVVGTVLAVVAFVQ